ncbi:MAG: superoxide dismutase, partial [Candidatus Marinimicrobia bacterium]|nr:superoxide dismutase [Candidatus Neomarinimicrobiota bacterium]
MNDTKKFVLPTLPYNANDLAPTISSQTVDLHYGKHHQAYFNML